MFRGRSKDSSPTRKVSPGSAYMSNDQFGMTRVFRARVLRPGTGICADLCCLQPTTSLTCEAIVSQDQAARVLNRHLPRLPVELFRRPVKKQLGP